MVTVRTSIERMPGDELLRLARVLKVPIVKRTIKRSWLVDEVLKELEKRNETTKPPIKLKSPAMSLKDVTKNFGKKTAVRRLNLQVNLHQEF